MSTELRGTELRCLVCNQPAKSLGDDPGGMVHEIKVPTVSGEVVVRICILCAAVMFEFLNNQPVWMREEKDFKRLRTDVGKLKT
jgi:hypothetical protein